MTECTCSNTRCRVRFYQIDFPTNILFGLEVRLVLSWFIFSFWSFAAKLLLIAQKLKYPAFYMHANETLPKTLDGRFRAFLFCWFDECFVLDDPWLFFALSLGSTSGLTSSLTSATRPAGQVWTLDKEVSVKGLYSRHFILDSSRNAWDLSMDHPWTVMGVPWWDRTVRSVLQSPDSEITSFFTFLFLFLVIIFNLCKWKLILTQLIIQI